MTRINIVLNESIHEPQSVKKFVLNTASVNITNQKMSSMQAYLNELDKQLAAENQLSTSLRNALIQGAYFNLYLGYAAFLHEVAIHYQFEHAASFTELRSFQEKKEQWCQYTDLLAELEEDSQSWLGDILSTYRQCQQLQVTALEQDRVQAAKSDNIIVSTAVVKDTQPVRMQKYCNNLKETIQQFRLLMQEW